MYMYIYVSCSDEQRDLYYSIPAVTPGQLPEAIISKQIRLKPPSEKTVNHYKQMGILRIRRIDLEMNLTLLQEKCCSRECYINFIPQEVLHIRRMFNKKTRQEAADYFRSCHTLLSDPLYRPPIYPGIPLNYHSAGMIPMMENGTPKGCIITEKPKRSSWRVANKRVCSNFMASLHNVAKSTLFNQRDIVPFRVPDDTIAREALVWLDKQAQFEEMMPHEKQAIYQFNHPSRKYVHGLYVQDMKAKEERAIQYSQFLKIWLSERSHYVLRKYMLLSKCTSCQKFRAEWIATKCEVARKILRAQRIEHLKQVRQERLRYTEKRQAAIEKPNEFLSMIVDGTDQASWAIPHFKQADKMTDSVFKSTAHLTGALVHGHGMYIYTMNDKWEKGANLVIEVIQRTLKKMEITYNGKLPTTFYLQLDNCSRENKNRFLFGYLGRLVQQHVFETIYISFLPVGHTHEDIDQAFGCISRKMRQVDALSRNDFYNAIAEGYTYKGKKPVFDHLSTVANFRDFIKDSMPPIRNITAPLHYRLSIHQDVSLNNVCTLWFKELRTDKNWSRYGEICTSDINMELSPDTVPPYCPKPETPESKIQEGKIAQGLVILFRAGRLSKKQFDDNMKDVNDLKTKDPVPFCWQDNGSFNLHNRDTNDGRFI